MKEEPEWKEVRERMRPGRLTRDGMLGQDARTLREITDADAATLAQLGITSGVIAERLRRITEMARKALGNPVDVEPGFEAWMEEGMGGMPCPFGHSGRMPKAITYLRHRSTGRLLQWSDLGIHMIEAHGFFQGKGSAFRVEPEEIVRLLGIDAAKKPGSSPE